MLRVSSVSVRHDLRVHQNVPGTLVASTDMLPGCPLNQSDETMAFLTVYGWTMWAVQTFEYRLAALSILLTPVRSPGRLLDTTQKVQSALQKQFAVYRHRFDRASAKELKNLLPEDIPEPLRSELDELVDARNDLAHRYLRRTLDGRVQPDLRSELQALQNLGQRFFNTSEKLVALMDQAVAERPPNLSDTQYDALQRLGREAAEGASLDEALRGKVSNA
jgi:hypothetical protein